MPPLLKITIVTGRLYRQTSISIPLKPKGSSPFNGDNRRTREAHKGQFTYSPIPMPMTPRTTIQTATWFIHINNISCIIQVFAPFINQINILVLAQYTVRTALNALKYLMVEYLYLIFHAFFVHFAACGYLKYRAIPVRSRKCVLFQFCQHTLHTDAISLTTGTAMGRLLSISCGFIQLNKLCICRPSFYRVPVTNSVVHQQA